MRMLSDYLDYFVDTSRFPFVVLWFDWCLLAYWEELLICLAIAWVYFTYEVQGDIDPALWDSAPLIVLSGVSLWCVYCTLRQGYALG